MRHYIKNIIPGAVALLTLGLASCADDLDVTPKDPNLVTADQVSAEALLNKCYANMAVAGNYGANGDSDIDGIDGGTSGFIRQIFNANELTTDESICSWGDDGISAFNYTQFDASHPMLNGLYNRLYTGIAFCNQYISDFGDYDETMTAEARFMRALYYYELLDGWGNVAFTTSISSELPEQIQRADLFDWVESELLEVEGLLSDQGPVDEGTDGYGRASKYTAEILLARLYLNAEVYTGTAQWDKAAEYAEKVINSPYKLHTTNAGAGWSAYQELFMGDNGTNGASEECLLAVLQDGQQTTSWGTTLFLMAGCMDNSEIINPDGVTPGNNTTEGWAGNRMRPELVDKFFPNGNCPEVDAFEMPAQAGDDRALFQSAGRTYDVDDPTVFTNGYAVCKFNNFRTAGTAGSTQFPDADFQFFRVAEAYLIYAEATARQNGGSATTQGVTYLNTLRARANATSRAGYSLSDICDEWSREFYYEGLRRPTLIRFDRYAGNVNYNWQWKGGVKAGRNVDAHYNLFAIPVDDLNANRNLTQNEGY